jgi:hypothetical protein
MKRIVTALAMVILFGSALQTMGQAKGGSKAPSAPAQAAPAKAASPPASAASSATLTCTGADGASACTAQQVRDLNSGLASGKRMHKPFLADIESLTLRKAGGGLTCTQTDGSACTDDQLSAVIELASTLNSSDGAIHITKTWDSSSPK